jgi:hypothetical protein
MPYRNTKLWWIPPVKEFIAFFAGIGLLFQQAIFAPQAQTILVVAAVAMMGVLGSGVAQRALKRIIEENGGDSK